MKTTRVLPAALLAIVFLGPLVSAASAVAPATQPVATIQQWFADLTDRDADVRETATDRLMQLTRGDLPSLRHVVEQARPLAPTQSEVLHDVVVHVYLSGETYDADWTRGFLGVTQMPGTSAVAVPDPDAGDAPAAAADPAAPGNPLAGQEWGVPVGDRLPGFCAYGVLRTGDIILAIVNPPRVRQPAAIGIDEAQVDEAAQPQQPGGDRLYKLRHWEEFTRAVKTFPAGRELTFEILRQGKVRRVAITLSPYPQVAAPALNAPVEPFLEARREKAEAYWEQTFAPLVDNGMS